MTTYFNGLGPKNRLTTALNLAAKSLKGLPDTRDLTDGMIAAEGCLIACGLPADRFKGAVASWTIPTREESGAPTGGHGLVVTVRRFAKEWRLVEAATSTIAAKAPSDVIIFLPIKDLKQLRENGSDLIGFEPYEEEIVRGSDGRYQRVNTWRVYRAMVSDESCAELIDGMEAPNEALKEELDRDYQNAFSHPQR